MILAKRDAQRLDGFDQTLQILRGVVFALFLIAIERFDDLSPEIGGFLHFGQINGVLIHQIDGEVTGEGVPRLFSETQPFRGGEFMLDDHLAGTRSGHVEAESSVLPSRQSYGLPHAIILSPR